MSSFSLRHNAPSSEPVSPSSGSFPSVYLESPEVIDLPEKGQITFCFTRGPVTVRGPHGGNSGGASCQLELKRVCEFEACDEDDVEEADEEPGTDRIDAIFAKAAKEESEEKDAD